MKKLFTAAIASLAAAAMLVIGASAADFTVSPAATGEILGDANGDTAINARDILAIKREVVNIEKAKVGADANADGKINARDILAIKRQIVGIQNLTDIPGSTVKILAVDGVNIKDMAIVAPAGTENTYQYNISFAAEELRNYLGAATGYSRSVEFGSASTEHAIYLEFDPTIEGEPYSKYDTKLGYDPATVACKEGDLGVEGFTIEIRDGDIHIIGGKYRGCMYGVYEFLEKYVGWRFINDDRFVYPADIISLHSGLSETQIPQLRYRYSGNPIGSDDSRFSIQRTRMNAHEYYADHSGRTGYTVGNHFANAHSWAYYKDENFPFSFSDAELNKRVNNLNYSWQPCFSTDFDEMFRGLLNYSDMVFKQWGQACIPGQSQFSFSSNDNGNYCQCDSCRESYSRIGITGASVEFASKAADMYQDYYPGIKLYTIFYDKTPPADGVCVSENLIIMFCGIGCNNHVPEVYGNSCNGGLNPLGSNNYVSESSLPAWCDVAQNVYFWEYGVNYCHYLAPLPNVFNIKGDLQFAYESGVTGIYYESCSCQYSFEGLKAYIAARYIWNPEMSDEECDYLINEYLWRYYGEGYKDIYTLIEMMTAAGDTGGTGHWQGNHDRPWDIYDPKYLAAHAEELYALCQSAVAQAGTAAQRQRTETMTMHVYFLALCATYQDQYVNGTDAGRQQYTARYEYMYNYIKNTGYLIFCDNEMPLPKECTLDKDPMIQFYESGSWLSKD